MSTAFGRAREARAVLKKIVFAASTASFVTMLIVLTLSAINNSPYLGFNIILLAATVTATAFSAPDDNDSWRDEQ